MSGIHAMVFIQAAFRLESPMRIGDGEQGSLVCDENNIPYVPATSLAGAVRHALPEEQARKLFGYVSTQRGSQEKAETSRIFVSDGRFDDGWHVIVREGVALDEYHTAIAGKKFILRAVDRGAVFRMRFELELRSAEEDALVDVFLRVLSRMNNGEITLGARGTRGFGRVSVIECRMKRYKGEELLASIDHKPENDEPIKLPEADEADSVCLRHTIRLRQPLCVGEYPILRAEGDANKVQMTSGGQPVIPGTSWAGMFRHAAEHLLRRLGADETTAMRMCDELFGSDFTRGVSRSVIRFEETLLDGRIMRLNRRTAINRFSGGASNGALYAEEFLYPGEQGCSGELAIHIRKGQPCSEWGQDLMELLLRELNAGRMYIGGGGAFGHGLLTVEELGQNDGPAYGALAKALKDSREAGGHQDEAE